MAGNADIRLLGFKGFEASERFLCSLDDDIWVSRRNWKELRPWPSAARPEDLTVGDEMRAELERSSSITVMSVHAGKFNGKLYVCGEAPQSELMLDKIGTLGATSMLLIDACYGSALASELKGHGLPGSLIAFLDYGPGEEQFTWGRDSVTVIGSVIREICYPHEPDLGPDAVRRAVKIANAQTTARNNAERERGVTNKKAMRPILRTLEC